MKRALRCFLLCLAMIALPAQGIAAAVMMVCSTAQSIQAPSRHAVPAAAMAAVAVDSPAIESMMLRHAAMKSVAEAALAGGHCHDASAAPHETPTTPATAGEDDMAAAADLLTAHPAGTHAGHHASHGAGGSCSACAACAAGAVIPTVLPELALASHGHAAPRAALAAFAGFLPAPSDRPPAARC
ncbi:MULTISPECIES: hypothetical protein [Cupriavidus]